MGSATTNPGQTPASASTGSITRRAPIVAALLAVTVVGLLAFALLSVQADNRRDVEKRFTERAKVTAAVTSSLFSSSVGSSAAQNARTLGGPTVSVAALDRQAQAGNSLFAVVLDARGNLLAASTGTDAEVIASLVKRPDYVRAAITSGFGLSDVLTRSGNQAMDFASGFKDLAGQPRVLVTGIPSKLISNFVGGYLKSLPDAEHADAYVVDANSAVVAATRTDARLGQQVPDETLADRLASASYGTYGSRFSTVSRVTATPWRVVLSAKTDTLYASVNGSKRLVPWVTLALLALAALMGVALLGRVVRSASLLSAANDELGETNERLALSHKRLDERATELARSNAELEQFASVASHDLQEPLRKIQAFGEQLEVKYAENLPEEATDYLQRMRKAAERMQRLIEDLLRFSRLTTRAEPFEWVDLTMVAHEVLSDLEIPVSAAGATVEIGDLGKLQADGLQMRQLLQNLIANGVKFRRPGVAPHVTVEAEHRAGQVVVRVTDNGIGFEDRHRERIFRVFERLHGRSEFEGTGIGLALCRRIVERHSGTISAHGTPGTGSTFTVVLPIEHPDPEPGPTLTSEGEGEGDVGEHAARGESAQVGVAHGG